LVFLLVEIWLDPTGAYPGLYGEVLTWPVAAALLGAAQWSVLRGLVPSAGRWVLRSAWSGAAGFLLAAVLFVPALGILAAALQTPVWLFLGLMYGIPGAVVGSSQSGILRVRPPAAGWLPPSIIGWSAFGMAARYTPRFRYPAEWLLAWLLGGLAYGAITGLALVRLLPARPSD
jgi:hypothetical protein